MKFSQLKKPWFEYWFAANVCVRLCWLSILLRVRTLPELLEQLTPERGAQRPKNASHSRPRGANYCAGLSFAPVSWAILSTDLPAAGPGALRHVNVFGLCRDHPFWHPQDGGAVARA
jgi:hypothetical protein